MKYSYFLFLIFGSSFFTNISAQSNTGTLAGTIADENGEALIGATIFVGDKAYATISNEYGSFHIADIPAGTYSLTSNYIGYLPTKQEVEIRAGEFTRIRISCSTNNLELETIMVTAEKRSEALQNVPLSVTAVDAKEVKSLQISNINQIGRISPNFLTFDDGGAWFPLVSTRGVVTIDDSPIIGVYVDDVPFYNISSFPSYFGDIERIEVLKGPQGTLYGRNSIGGVMNIVSKRPTNELKGYVSAGYGNLNQYDFQAGISAPLVKDKLFIRLSGGATARDGYVQNLFDSTQVLGREVYSGNLRLTYLPSTQWALTLNASMEDRQNTAYAFVGGFEVAPGHLDSLRSNHPYEINQNAIGDYSVTNINNAFKASYQGESFAFDAISAVQLSDRKRASDDFDFSPFDIQEAARGDGNTLTLSQEFRLRSTNDGPFSWLGGLFLYRVREEGLTELSNGADNAFFAPTPEIGALYPYSQTNDNVVTQTGFSIFGEAAYNLRDNLTLTLGLRYEGETSALEEEQFYTRNGEAFEFAALGAIPSSFELETTFDALSPKVNLAFRPSERSLLYANAARGYRPGGVNPFINDPTLATFGPEFSWNYEIGSKNKLWNNRVKLNLTAFYSTYTGQQLFTILDLTNFAFGVENLGNSRNLGVELESEYVLAPGLSLSANIGWLDAEFTDYTTFNFFTAEEIVNDGNRQIVSPEWNGSIGLNFNTDISEKWRFAFSIDYQFYSEIFFDAQNQLSQPYVGLLNTRVIIGHPNLEFAFWGQNMNDQIYYGYGYGVGGSGGFASYGLPRTVGSSITAKF
ncbi:MAG: TonB-dependent receptor [Bacteroidota bacterium]